MKRISFLVFAGIIGISACKKEEVTPTPKTTKEKIVGVWKGDEVEFSIVAPPPIGTQNQTEDISFMTIEFNNDGTAIADSAGFDPEITNWSLLGDDKIILDTDTFDIISLTATQFHFGFSETDSIGTVPISINSTIKLKK